MPEAWSRIVNEPTFIWNGLKGSVVVVVDVDVEDVVEVVEVVEVVVEVEVVVLLVVEVEVVVLLVVVVEVVVLLVVVVEVVLLLVVVVITAGGAKTIRVRSCAVAVSPPPAFFHRISIFGPLEGRYPCVAIGMEELIIESSITDTRSVCCTIAPLSWSATVIGSQSPSLSTLVLKKQTQSPLPGTRVMPAIVA